MLGKSIPEYIFIRAAITALRLIAPLSMLCIAWMLLVPAPAYLHPKWTLLYYCLQVYATLEVVFFVCVYLPRRYHLQKAANHPRLSREERQALFQRCSEYLTSADYPSGWFFRSQSFHRKNVLEWLLWALFSTSMNADWQEWEDEIVEYLTVVENVLGQLPDSYNKDTACMRLTLDPVPMLHRPLLWYMIVGVIDFIKVSRIGIDPTDHSGKIQYSSFMESAYIGLYPYASFLSDLALQHPDVGIVVPEFLSISSRITSPPLSRNATVTAIQQILDTHSLQYFVIAAHSYGTVITAQLFRCPDLVPRVVATLFVDPIPFLLHLPYVAYNFVYRSPRTANEWMLWYFASRDPDVSRTLSRHFFWTENILWKEDLQDKIVAVALSGQDQVVNAEAVRKYLTEEDEGNPYWRRGQLEVLCYPELDHAMIFDIKKEWRQLIGVLDRFVCELN